MTCSLTDISVPSSPPRQPPCPSSKMPHPLRLALHRGKWRCLTLEKLEHLEIMISPGHWGCRGWNWVAAIHFSLGTYTLVCPGTSGVPLVKCLAASSWERWSPDVRWLPVSVVQILFCVDFKLPLACQPTRACPRNVNHWFWRDGAGMLWCKHIPPWSQHTTSQCLTLHARTV